VILGKDSLLVAELTAVHCVAEVHKSLPVVRTMRPYLAQEWKRKVSTSLSACVIFGKIGQGEESWWGGQKTAESWMFKHRTGVMMVVHCDVCTLPLKPTSHGIGVVEQLISVGVAGVSWEGQVPLG
jgi:hypothetical protein